MLQQPVAFVQTSERNRSADFVKSPFRYPGGKFYALRYILPFLNCVPHEEYREPFVGGGSVFFAKPKARINWINDLEVDLIITYQVMADPALREALCKRVSKEIATPERHEEVRDFQPKTRLDIAFRTFYLNRTSYSGIIKKPAWGYKDGKSSPPPNWAAFLRDAGAKLDNVRITHLDFAEVVTAPSKEKGTLIYLDPPYFYADQKRAYTKHFVEADHVRLANLLRKTPYFFCLSYDDCDAIRDLYSWAHIQELTWFYNTANKKGSKRDKGKELIITNYTVLRPQQYELPR